LHFSARDFLRERFVLNLAGDLDDVNVAGNFVRQLEQSAAISGLLRDVDGAAG
jgi:hypothetical protein